MKVLFLLLVMFTPILIISGQISESERFARIPAEHRPKLKEKLEKFINYYRENDWGGVYACLCNPKQSKEEFIQSTKKFNWVMGQLVEFNPVYHGTLAEPPEFADAGYRLTGCVKFKKGENYTHSLHAYLIKGEWCFGMLYPTDLMEGLPQEPCKMSDYAPAPNQKN